jgi:Divergent InlB B-repeat domain
MGARARLLCPALCALALSLALPSLAQASTKLLSVSKEGSGTGTVTSSPEGIECGAACAANFPEGQLVTLSASPGPDTLPVRWTGCDSVNGEGRCTVAMSGARSVTATFSLEQRTLTVAKRGSGSGTVSSSPAGIACGATCSAGFDLGATVTLSASPGASTQPVQWTGCDSVNGEGKCVVAMSGARQVTATFDLSGPRLSVTRAGTGTGTVTSSPAGIECGSGCSASFLSGTLVTLTATPAPHVEAALWTGCDRVTAGGCEVTMSAAKAVTATFNLEPLWVEYPLTVQRTGNGAGTVTSSPAGILCGTICTASFLTAPQTLTLTASPAQGSVFAGFSGGGCTGSGACAIAPKRAETVKAKFSLAGRRTLSVTKAGSGTGTVTGKAAGIACGQTCSSQVSAGKKVSLAAKAATGSTFAGFSGACTGAKACKVTMSEARQVIATFAAPAAPPPAACLVPKLRGKSLKKARKALSRSHCSLGKVKRPKGHRKGALVVRSSEPGAGRRLGAGAKVSVRLGAAKATHGRAGKRQGGAGGRHGKSG